MHTWAHAEWMFGVLLLSLYCALQVSARRCVKCENFSAKGSVLGYNPFSGHTDPYCKTKTTATDTCYYNEYCGTVTGTITVSFSILGSYTAEMTVRRCMKDPGLGTGCHSYDDIEDLLSDVLSFLTYTGTVTVTGQVCLTTGFFDSITTCGSGTIFLSPGVCVHWGVIVGSSVGLLILLIGICVCCCVCCCSASQRRPGAVHTATVQPQVMTIQTASQMPSNPGYGGPVTHNPAYANSNAYNPPGYIPAPAYMSPASTDPAYPGPAYPAPVTTGAATSNPGNLGPEDPDAQPSKKS